MPRCYNQPPLLPICSQNKGKILQKSEFSPLDLEFDFGYNDKSLLAMAQLHNYFCSLDPRIIPFIGIIRLWSKLVGFSAHGLSGQMTPYIITQMALNYLQNIGFIPTIQGRVQIYI